MRPRNTLLVATLLAVSLMSGATHAALESRLGGLAVYDTDLNVTWLANANLAASDTFGVTGINADGTMSWTTAQSWIAAMNAADYLGYNNWRLPATPQSDPSCTIGVGSCSGSEMGHLFYDELGGIAGSSITTTHNANYGLFNNLQYNGIVQTIYWSGTEEQPNEAWVFIFSSGNQLWTYDQGNVYNQIYAWAVLPGDVAAVPEAHTWAMLLAGLGLVGVVARRRKCASATSLQ
jgi:MYXO-CTERM domain-containing protein